MDDKEQRLKRLQYRSGQRGTGEMDKLLGGFAATRLAGLTDAQLDAYQALLDAPDWDAFAWVSGQTEPPPEMAEIVALIKGR